MYMGKQATSSQTNPVNNTAEVDITMSTGNTTKRYMLTSGWAVTSQSHPAGHANGNDTM
jgi:hypothetical protein